MKSILIFGLMLLMIGCCPVDGKDGIGVKGDKGDVGLPGLDGSNGHDGSTGPKGDTGDTGAVGPQGPQGVAGNNGLDGLTGPSGSNGLDGVGCTVTSVLGGALVECGGTTSAVITNGLNGTNGVNGTNGADAPPSLYSVVEIIDPCGSSGGYDEVLLKLGNGKIMAHYAGGGNLQFLTLIGNGSYVTTDTQACHFTVNNGVVSW